LDFHIAPGSIVIRIEHVFGQRFRDPGAAADTREGAALMVPGQGEMTIALRKFTVRTQLETLGILMQTHRNRKKLPTRGGGNCNEGSSSRSGGIRCDAISRASNSHASESTDTLATRVQSLDARGSPHELDNAFA
jgi:hypothetical protein